MAVEQPTRVVIADDHPIVRSGLRGWIDGEDDMVVVGEAASAAQAAEIAERERADVVVADLSMPGGGPDGIRAIRERAPGAVVLVLTVHEDTASIRGALRAGATGYLVKRTPGRDVVDGIRRVRGGERLLDRSLDVTSIDELDDEEEPPPLSRRERQVVELIARGHTNKEVAEKLGLSVKSVETYRARVLDKLGMRSRADLVGYALGAGLLDPSRDPLV